MRNTYSLSITMLGLLALVLGGLASTFAQTPPAQAIASAPPAPEDNPAVANCNVTPDTNQGAKPPPVQITATRITADLLTSGQIN